MARINDVASVFANVTGIKKVFNDGRIFEQQKAERHLGNIPYVELVEDDIDLSEQSSTTRLRRANCRGAITMLKERDSIPDMIQAIETAFKNRDDMSVNIEERTLFLNRMWKIPVDITYFETVAKT